MGEDERVGEEGHRDNEGATEPVAGDDPTGEMLVPGDASADAEPAAATPATDAATPATDAASGHAATEAAAPAPVPRKQRPRWVITLSILGTLIVMLAIASFISAHYTSASSFCDTCHEMEPYYQSWQASSHSSAECRDCHIPPGLVPYIETKLGSLREIYVHVSGNPEAPLAVTSEIPDDSCLRCHEDPPPDPTLPTATFSHEKHSDQDCISCHIRFVHTTVNPPDYVDPAKMSSCFQCHDGTTAPNQCSYCHTAPHEPRGECSSCHDTTSFSSAAGKHPFELTAAHADVTCTQCHVSKPGVENIPGTELARADAGCVSCHEDQHGGLTDCAGCHTPSTWKNVDFEHPFPLTGAHSTLTCKDCHVSKPGGATVAGTQFPAADPACISCHGDQHKGLTDCADCHNTTAWKPADFKHPFALSGAHATLSCADCHVTKPGGTTVPGTSFPAASAGCVSCHKDQHGGLTDCARCHTTKGWTPTTFRHPSAGEHSYRSFACTQCHPNGFASASCTCHGGNPPSD